MRAVTRAIARFRRRLRGARHEAEPVARSGLGEPPARAEADDAELDALRGELVRELDRLAAGADGSSGFRRC